MKPVPLEDARDESAFGEKAVRLGTAIRDGLAVPCGIALPTDLVAALVEGRGSAQAALQAAATLEGPLAVRSSAVGEDARKASFPGIHASLLGVSRLDELVSAVRAIHESGRSDAARAYRDRLGLAGPMRMGVVVQALVPAEVAGVLFTKHPFARRDELVIEAAWGLGPTVSSGLVTPDCYRVDRSGAVLDVTIGHKTEAIRALPGGGVATEPVPGEIADAACLDEGRLAALRALASRCEELFGTGQDIEWAFAGEALNLP
jgi:pyruvate, water dikinase